MKSITCPCGWTYQSANEDELVQEAQKHGKEVHNQESTREEVLAMTKSVDESA